MPKLKTTHSQTPAAETQASIPNRPEMEIRLEALQAELVEMDQQIIRDELPPGPTRSPQRTRRDTLIARITDLRKLLGR